MNDVAIIKQMHEVWDTLLIQHGPVTILHHPFAQVQFLKMAVTALFSRFSVFPSPPPYLRGQVAQQQPTAASGGCTITPSWAYKLGIKWQM